MRGPRDGRRRRGRARGRRDADREAHPRGADGEVRAKDADGEAGGADFAWMTGFECSTFPQVGMDELALTQDPPEITPHASGYRLARIPTASLDAWRRYASASSETTVEPLARSPTNAGIPLW